MKQISFYETIEELANKTFCQLIEKCYDNSLKVVIYAPNLQIQEYYDKLLWTYSQKKFVPHGTKQDSFPELQPIYITCELENPNNASVLVYINQACERILDLIHMSKNQIQVSNQSLNFERVIVVYNSSESLNFNKVISEIRSLENFNLLIDYFKQDNKGGWIKEN